MSYYDIKRLAASDKLSKLRTPVVNLKYAKRKMLIDFSSSKYVAVLADQISPECKDFEDNCRRHLFGISTIKLGYKEYTELHMIRTEMKVLILRVLQEDAYAYSQGHLRADQHMVEKIDLKKFADMHKVDLTGSLESDRLDRYITNLLEGLREEMGVKEKSDCECYLIENREKIIQDEAIIEKFYFFHNALERRIVYVVYRLLRTSNTDTKESESDDPGDSMSTDSVADSDTKESESEDPGDSMSTDSVADSEANSKANSEADSEGDESENEFSAGLPQPGDCDLFYVNLDSLFPSHTDNELFVRFLKRNMDLQLLAKAPDDHLFALLGPAEKSVNPSTKFLCVLWVSLEGPTFQQSVFQPFGDMIYPLFPNQFVDQVIPSLSGANIKRVLIRQGANGVMPTNSRI